MDPSSIPPPPPPTVVPFSDEPNPPPPTATHPPYAEMIYKAIEALKEKNGSTKSAISKYIDQVYNPYLPPPSTHSTLLTQNLKRLKDNGFLQMVNNNSYILPRSVLDSTQVPRPRGRPRKLQVQQPQELVHVVNQNAEPVWAALGLSDEPQVLNMVAESEEKRVGRPRKSAVDSVGQVVLSATVSSRGRGRPPGSKNKKKKKKLGRPAKIESLVVVPVAGDVAGDGSGGIKRRPGRPRKNQLGVLIPLDTAAEGEVPVALADGDVPVAVGTSIQGRPRRNTGVGSGGRGRGRGGGTLPAQHWSSFRRPVGRPKKETTSAHTSQNLAGEGDIKRKLEHFQTKVKESLDVLKPYFTHESPLSAIAAIQDLEVLGAMDLNAPPNYDETLTQQPQQPSQQQQQSLQYQQQPQQPLQLPLQHHIIQQPLALAPQQFFQQQFPPFQHLYHPQPQQYQNQQPPQQFQPQSSFLRLFNP